MSAVQLLAAAVLALAVGALAGAIVIIGLVRRVRALEAESSTVSQSILKYRIKQLEVDSHTHDFLGSKPKLMPVLGAPSHVPVPPLVPPRPVAATAHASGYLA